MQFSGLKAFFAAAAMALALVSAPVPSRAQDNPSAVLDAIRASGVLRVPGHGR